MPSLECGRSGQDVWPGFECLASDREAPEAIREWYPLTFVLKNEVCAGQMHAFSRLVIDSEDNWTDCCRLQESERPGTAER